MPSSYAMNSSRALSFTETLANCLDVLRDASVPSSQQEQSPPRLTLSTRERPTENALRVLFYLSESSSRHHNNCVAMARYGELVPELLDFIKICAENGRHDEKSLALLVLKNISAPNENKRLIAFIHRGARIIGDLLSMDPSCYMMALVLVSFTSTDDDLCNEIASREEEFHLVGSLTYALRVASLTEEEFALRKLEIINNDPSISTAERLVTLVAEDEFSKDSNKPLSPIPAVRVFPETARWCLSALKNLTRPSIMAPSRSFTAAHAIAHSGIVKHILRYITMTNEKHIDHIEPLGTGSTSSDDKTPEPIEPSLTEDTLEAYSNDPKNWDATSPQDAALFILMNLCLSSVVHEHMCKCGTVSILLAVANYQPPLGRSIPVDEAQTMRFQKLKSRIALSWLLGGEGSHYGKQKQKSLSTAERAAQDPNNKALVLSDQEARALVELLANVLHRRVITGAPSSSAATLSTKCILYAIRCLLTHFENRAKLSKLAGPKLNILLMKVIAMRATDQSPLDEIDMESAENALFSLYLLSSFGFKHVFLPYWFFSVNIAKSLMAKILVSFEEANIGNMTPSAQHAKDQLLLRIKYLCFDELLVASPKFFHLQLHESDLKFPSRLLASLRQVQVNEIDPGASPLLDVHDRAVFRAQALDTMEGVWFRRSALFENQGAVNKYPSALLAAQELSMETKKKHLGDDTAIDEMLIANVIVTSIKKKKDCFDHSWRWGDPVLLKEKSHSKNEQFPVLGMVSSMFSSDPSRPTFDMSCGTITEVYWGRPGT